MIIIGIDPGLDGALAILRDGELLYVYDLVSERVGGTGHVKRRLSATALRESLQRARAVHGPDDFVAVIERVHAGGGQGVASVYSLGDTAGCVRGVVQSLDMRIEYVTPAEWKRAMKVPPDKGVARTLAAQRWPHRQAWFARAKDHNRAEAALIAAYGWEQFG